MKRRFSLLVLFASLLLARAVCAQAPFGSLAVVLPYTPSKLLADPSRLRVYAANPATNSVVVIDTTTLKVIATVPIGSNPVDMAISPDGNTLYVANSGSTLSAIGVLDLNTLAVRTSFALPGAPRAVAAGLNGRVYALAPSASISSTIHQFDGATGTVQTTYTPHYGLDDLLQISPDGTRLFSADTGDSYGTLSSIDVSTATPVALQANSSASENGSQLVVSHQGRYICLPSGGGNPGSGNYGTALFSTSDVTKFYGSFVNGAYPGPLAFSPDDSLVYQTRTGVAYVIDVFDTTSFFKLKEVNLPLIGSQSDPDTIPSIVVDNTGSYLFISEGTYSGTSTAGQLAVVTTGTGTLTPPSIFPVITSSTSASATQGTAFSYQITAANVPTSFNAANLPAGLSVNTATGLISGTPTVSGYSTVTIGATNASGTATANLQLDVVYSNTGYVPVITTTSLAAGVVGQAYSQTVTATNGAYDYSAINLPVGLSIDSYSGIISGTPTLAGTSTVTLQATNNYGVGTAKLPLTVTSALPVITSGTIATGTPGTAFRYQITATNTPTSFAAAGLPGGLSVNTATGLISGAPTSLGTFSVTLTAVNAAGTGTARLVISVTTPPPVISSPATGAAMLGQPFAYQISASNNPTSYAASGLPAGLSANTVTGLISGTPLASGTFPVALSATNTTGTGTLTLSLTVNVVVPVITGSLSAGVMQGQAFSYQITASNVPTSYAASGLPDGLTLNTSTGLISGVPTQPGAAAIVLSALNAAGAGTATLNLTVTPSEPVVTLLAMTPSVAVGSGDAGEFVLSLSSAASDDVVVNFTIKGTAVNGTDYVLLKGSKKIKAGKTQKAIKIEPLGDLGGAAKKIVTLSLAPGDGYLVGSTSKAKVKITTP